jgi:hypothetical protein
MGIGGRHLGEAQAEKIEEAKERTSREVGTVETLILH